MSSLLPTLIAWLQQFGYPALWLSIFVAAIGLPIPGMLLLLAAGAFAVLGDFNVFILAPLAISASVSGDAVSYFIGRRIGSRVLDWLEQQRRFPWLSPHLVGHAQGYFKRRGAWAIFLSRFLVAGLGGTINLLSGAERYPYRRFLFYDVCGQIFGALIPLSLGYIFGASWEYVGNVLGAFSIFVLALFVAIFLAIYLVKLAQRTKAAKEAAAHLVEEQQDTILNGTKRGSDKLSPHVPPFDGLTKNSDMLSFPSLDVTKGSSDTLPL